MAARAANNILHVECNRMKNNAHTSHQVKGHTSNVSVRAKDARSAISSARHAAYALLVQYDPLTATAASSSRTRYIKDMLRSSEKLAALTSDDRAFAEFLCMGSVEAYRHLCDVLGVYCKRFSHVEKNLHVLLILAAFELLYMEHEHYAVCSQYAALARSIQPRYVGLVSGVLHTLIREELPRMDKARDTLRAAYASLQRGVAGAGDVSESGTCDSGTTTATDELALAAARDVSESGTCDSGTTTATDELALAAARVSALPAFMLRAVANARGLEFMLRYAVSMRASLPIFYIVNPYLAHAHQGVSADDVCINKQFGMYRVCGAARGHIMRAVEQGSIVASDIAAQLICTAIAYTPHERVLEIGAGNGTKTLVSEYIAHVLKKPPLLHAVCDIVPAKLRTLQARFKKAAIPTTLEIVHAETALQAKLASATYDCVFLDAPCSGISTIRRHSDIALRTTPASIDPDNSASLPAVQLQLLREASRQVAPDGSLYYSTCSMLACEHDDVVAAFLVSREGAGFARAAFPASYVQLVRDTLEQVYINAASVCPETSRWISKDACITFPHDSTLLVQPYPYGPDAHMLTRLVRCNQTN